MLIILLRQKRFTKFVSLGTLRLTSFGKIKEVATLGTVKPFEAHYSGDLTVELIGHLGLCTASSRLVV